jgi:quercetin dioxygenase-like cupin family protein
MKLINFSLAILRVGFRGKPAIVAFILQVVFIKNLSAGASMMNPEPKIIKAEMRGQDYIRLLGGPPESIVMRSGEVLLQPGKMVGKHNTECNEELLIVLEGEGSLLLTENRQLEMKAGSVLYCPPETEHDVRNTGPGILRYIYVTARTK